MPASPSRVSQTADLVASSSQSGSSHGVCSRSCRGWPEISDSSSSRLYLLDGGWRVKLSDRLRVRPNLKLARRTFDDGSLESFALGSVALDYDLPKDTLLELEIGTRVSSRPSPGFAEETNEPWITAGISKQF